MGGICQIICMVNVKVFKIKIAKKEVSLKYNTNHII
jgi:hypothetical protein